MYCCVSPYDTVGARQAFFIYHTQVLLLVRLLSPWNGETLGGREAVVGITH